MITTLTEQDLKDLRLKAESSANLRSRICFHKDEAALQQFMLICLLKHSEVGIHRHPLEKSESYVLLRGEMEIGLFDDVGVLVERVTLNNTSPCLFIPGGTFHEPMSVSPYCMYFEAYPGPFCKEIDVDYLSER